MITYRRLLSLCVALFTTAALSACSASDVGAIMEEYLWQKRVLLVFTDTPESASISQQNEQLLAQKDGLKERDVVIWYLAYDTSVNVDSELKPQLSTRPFYRYFNVKPQDDTVILLGKDGEEKYRGDIPFSVENVFTLIDTMPMRRQETTAAPQ